MSDLSTFAALRTKRAEIAGQIAGHHKELAKLQRDLAKVDGIIKLFDPEYRVGDIPAKQPRKRLFLFKHGELGRLILDCLRRAREPQPTADVVAYVAQAIGQPDAAQRLHKTVHQNLRYMAGQ